jgi:hypothetical protein
LRLLDGEAIGVPSGTSTRMSMTVIATPAGTPVSQSGGRTFSSRHSMALIGPSISTGRACASAVPDVDAASARASADTVPAPCGPQRP